MAKTSFYGKLAKIAYDALLSLKDYNGEKLVTLPTGEKAIDNDDSWIIVSGHEDTDEPVLRGKKATDNNGDELIFDIWSYEDICAYADNLLNLQD